MMENISQRQYTSSHCRKPFTINPRVPSHLQSLNETKMIEESLKETLTKSQLESMILRFDSLLNELNGGELMSP